MKINNLNVLTYGYNYWGYIPNWFRNIKQFFRNIKYAYQRIIKGYCDQDIWDLDSFYSELFYQTLNELADTTIGYPGVGEFADTETTDGYEKWKDTLREMAEHFLNTQEWNKDIPVNKEASMAFEEMQSYVSDTYFEPTDKNYSRLVEKYTDKDAYNKAKEIWLEKENKANDFRNWEKDVACEMLKKYFFNLWD